MIKVLKFIKNLIVGVLMFVFFTFAISITVLLLPLQAAEQSFSNSLPKSAR